MRSRSPPDAKQHIGLVQPIITVWMPWERSMVFSDWIAIAAVIYIAAELPFRLAFENYYSVYVVIAESIELVVDFVFILDFLRQSNLACRP